MSHFLDTGSLYYEAHVTKVDKVLSWVCDLQLEAVALYVSQPLSPELILPMFHVKCSSKHPLIIQLSFLILHRLIPL